MFLKLFRETFSYAVTKEKYSKILGFLTFEVCRPVNCSITKNSGLSPIILKSFSVHPAKKGQEPLAYEKYTLKKFFNL